MAQVGFEEPSQPLRLTDAKLARLAVPTFSVPLRNRILVSRSLPLQVRDPS